MIEKALTGDRRYWGWIAVLLGVITIGSLFYLRQLTVGLTITGLSRSVTWGFYIAQFTFMVGVAASAVMVVLPYYLHDYKVFGRIAILGEFLAIGSVVDVRAVHHGGPRAAGPGVQHVPAPQPASILFWDTHRPLGLPAAERRDRAPEPEGRGPGHAAAGLGEAHHLPLHPLGHKHPHRHRLHLPGTCRATLLDDRHPGPTLPGLGLFLGPRFADPVLPAAAPPDALRRREGGDPAGWPSS